MTVTSHKIDRARIAEIGAREEQAYRDRTRKSAELFDRARQSLPLGVASTTASAVQPLSSSSSDEKAGAPVLS